MLFIEETAKGLTSKVCKVLERGGPDTVKDARRGSYEVLVFVLAHLDADAALYEHGIPSKLRDRLYEAFGENASLDRTRWAMLGKAKWHVFTPGCKFGTRSARKKPQQQEIPEDEEDMYGEDEAFEQEDDEAFDQQDDQGAPGEQQEPQHADDEQQQQLQEPREALQTDLT